MATKRKRKFSGRSAAAVVAGGIAGAGVAALLGKIGAPPVVVGTALTAVGAAGAAFLEGEGRLAVGSTVGTGALVLLSSALIKPGKDKKAEEHKAEKELATAGKDRKKVPRGDAVVDNVVALFERAKNSVALDDEERAASRAYRQAA